MDMYFHRLCIDQLNHYITQALVCSAPLPQSEDKKLLQVFGLMHLMIISGVHVQFLVMISQFLKKRVQENLNCMRLGLFIEPLALLFLCLSTAFSPPVIRVVFFRAISLIYFKKFLIRPTRALKSLVCLATIYPLSLWQQKEVSFILSLTFSLICANLMKRKSFHFSFFAYLLSLPIFVSIFSIPHFSSILINPVMGAAVSAFLLPMSILSLVSQNLEGITINLWWLCLDFLNYIWIYFNMSEEDFFLNNKSSYFYIPFVYLALLLFIEIIMRPYWKRQSFCF